MFYAGEKMLPRKVIHKLKGAIHYYQLECDFVHFSSLYPINHPIETY